MRGQESGGGVERCSAAGQGGAAARPRKATMARCQSELRAKHCCRGGQYCSLQFTPAQSRTGAVRITLELFLLISIISSDGRVVMWSAAVARSAHPTAGRPGPLHALAACIVGRLLVEITRVGHLAWPVALQAMRLYSTRKTLLPHSLQNFPPSEGSPANPAVRKPPRPPHAPVQTFCCRIHLTCHHTCQPNLSALLLLLM